jgi:hypothetical protein
MNSSPLSNKAYVESRQREMLARAAEARQAQLAREAQQAEKAGLADKIELGGTSKPEAERSRRWFGAKRGWRLGLGALFGTE